MTHKSSWFAVICLAASSASAHHSYAAFEMDKTVTIKGTVTKWEWTNPHSFLYVDAAGSDGSVHNWRIESVSPAMMAKVGFTRNTFKMGDKVEVTAHPGKEADPFVANFVAARLPDGKELGMGFTRGGGVEQGAPSPATARGQ